MRHFLVVDDSQSWNNFHCDNLIAINGENIEVYSTEEFIFDQKKSAEQKDQKKHEQK